MLGAVGRIGRVGQPPSPIKGGGVPAGYVALLAFDGERYVPLLAGDGVGGHRQLIAKKEA